MTMRAPLTNRHPVTEDTIALSEISQWPLGILCSIRDAWQNTTTMASDGKYKKPLAPSTQHSIATHSKAEHSKAQHSIAQLSSAQHRIAQLSSAQHSIA